ncbi:hypothetical protein P7C71_g1607, partial [Lecanoromycetidae sp. Uapishka_2]
MPPKKDPTVVDADLIFLWNCLNKTKNADMDFKSLGIDYDAVAKVHNTTKGAAAKRFSRLKLTLENATKGSTTNGTVSKAEGEGAVEVEGGDAAESSSPKVNEKGGKKRKAATPGKGSKAKKGKVAAEEVAAEEVAADEEADVEKIKVEEEEGSEGTLRGED